LDSRRPCESMFSYPGIYAMVSDFVGLTTLGFVWTVCLELCFDQYYADGRLQLAALVIVS
jgi:hypothetical protein